MIRKYRVRINEVPCVPKVFDRQARANSVDPDETLHSVASYQGLLCLPLIQQILDTTKGSKLYFLKFYNKYCKELRCPNT